MARRGRPVAEVTLTEDQRETLERWSRRAKSSQALALRCRIVLAAADGLVEHLDRRAAGLSAADGRQVAIPVRRRPVWTGWPTSPDPAPPGRSPTSRSRRWWWPLWSGPRPMPRTGRGHRWPPTAACRNPRSGGSGRPSGSSRIRSTRSSCPPTRSSSTRSATSSVSYLDPPEKALVLCVDEKSQIQALDRSAPVLPMMPGMPERRTHDYVRHGITTLFAALDVATGEVIGSIHRRHRAAEFRKFLTKFDKQVPAASGRAPDLRQLRHPQDAHDPGLAGRASPFPHALHPDLLVLAQPGRALVRATNRQAAPPRGAQEPSRPSNATSAPGSRDWNETLHRSSGPRPPTRSLNDSPHICQRIPGAGH